MAASQSSGSKGSESPGSRFVAETSPDGRSPFQLDRDRILYAGAFARLAEITQVVSPEQGYIFHNRLTHSLKVAQIARRIAEECIRQQPAEVHEIGGLDPDAAEAAGLAHDLGHPPFGHVAEYELNRLVRAVGLSDGYEGNAQSFRIVVKLAASDARDREDAPIQGLNLTARTLDGLLKYPWGEGDPEFPNKWGVYNTERDVFAWVRESRPARKRSATAEIMDWADDITFAVHDLLEFYCAGRVPIDRCKGQYSPERERLIRGMLARKPRWQAAKADYISALDRIFELFPFEPEERFTDSAANRAQLYNFSTGLIRYLASSLRLTPTSSGDLVTVDPFARCVAEVLKQFIWEYVIEGPELAVVQSGQRTAIRVVFERLMEAAMDKKYYLFPASYRENIEMATDHENQVRSVADCISGITERELLSFYRRLQGITG